MSTPFGDAIRAARKARNMKQQELADAIGMERSYLSKLENGDVADPESETRERVARGLDMTPNELMGYAGTSVQEERAWYVTDLDADGISHSGLHLPIYTLPFDFVWMRFDFVWLRFA